MELLWESTGRNDIVAELECTCPSAKWKGTNIEHLMNTKITLWGYVDYNFFDNVNKEPREFACSCGKKYSQQWFKNGSVIIEEIN